MSNSSLNAWRRERGACVPLPPFLSFSLGKEQGDEGGLEAMPAWVTNANLLNTTVITT